MEDYKKYWRPEVKVGSKYKIWNKTYDYDSRKYVDVEQKEDENESETAEDGKENEAEKAKDGKEKAADEKDDTHSMDMEPEDTGIARQFRASLAAAALRDRNIMRPSRELRKEKQEENEQ